MVSFLSCRVFFTPHILQQSVFPPFLNAWFTFFLKSTTGPQPCYKNLFFSGGPGESEIFPKGMSVRAINSFRIMNKNKEMTSKVKIVLMHTEIFKTNIHDTWLPGLVNFNLEIGKSKKKRASSEVKKRSIFLEKIKGEGTLWFLSPLVKINEYTLNNK